MKILFIFKVIYYILMEMEKEELEFIIYVFLSNNHLKQTIIIIKQKIYIML